MSCECGLPFDHQHEGGGIYVEGLVRPEPLSVEDRISTLESIMAGVLGLIIETDSIKELRERPQFTELIQLQMALSMNHFASGAHSQENK